MRNLRQIRHKPHNDMLKYEYKSYHSTIKQANEKSVVKRLRIFAFIEDALRILLQTPVRL